MLAYPPEVLLCGCGCLVFTFILLAFCLSSDDFPLNIKSQVVAVFATHSCWFSPGPRRIACWPKTRRFMPRQSWKRHPQRRWFGNILTFASSVMIRCISCLPFVFDVLQFRLQRCSAYLPSCYCRWDSWEGADIFNCSAMNRRNWKSIWWVHKRRCRSHRRKPSRKSAADLILTDWNSV